MGLPTFCCLLLLLCIAVVATRNASKAKPNVFFGPNWHQKQPVTSSRRTPPPACSPPLGFPAWEDCRSGYSPQPMNCSDENYFSRRISSRSPNFVRNLCKRLNIPTPPSTPPLNYFFAARHHPTRRLSHISRHEHNKGRHWLHVPKSHDFRSLRRLFG